MLKRAFIVFLMGFLLVVGIAGPTIIYAQNPSSKEYEKIKKEAGIKKAPFVECGIASNPKANVCCDPNTARKIQEKGLSWTNFIESIQKTLEKIANSDVLTVDKKFLFFNVSWITTPIRNAFKNMSTALRIFFVAKNLFLSEESLLEFPLCFEGRPTDINNLKNCKCVPTNEGYLYSSKEPLPAPVVVNKLGKLCKYIENTNEKAACESCVLNGGYFSALGCIYFQPQKFVVVNLFGWGLSLAGIFAFLCIIYSAIEIQLSRGNPEKIKSAKDRITACVVGLLVIFFSVFILRLVGVNILNIPGLS